MQKRNVLILCTGNSCRSQMAEGLINHDLDAEWHAESAGTDPAGYVHPLAIEAMRDIGIDIADYRSKHTDEFRATNFDLVITVCDDAAENCPVWLGKGAKAHIGFPDPAKATGTDAAVRGAFAEVRDDMRHSVLQYLTRFTSPE